jgi:PleD family two-component response regulator
MSEEEDIALVLLDVVMDTVDSGFNLIRFIRHELENKDVRIILRTGQSGTAPEDEVIINYDINDFKDKTELTVSKLRTTIISALKAYSHLKIIAQEQTKLLESRLYLDQIIEGLYTAVITVDCRP